MPPVVARISPPSARIAIEATISGIFQAARSPVEGFQRCTVYEGMSVQYRHPSRGDHSGPSPSQALQSTTHSASPIAPLLSRPRAVTPSLHERNPHHPSPRAS